MTFLELQKIFSEELIPLYTPTEISELFSVFIQKATGYDRFRQRQAANDILSEKDTADLKKILADLKTGKPFQQILGETEFYGLKFFVTENVLIPRPETEELLELAIKEIKNSALDLQKLKVLDIGTGSGIIPVVLKKHFPKAAVSAIDFSQAALKTARKNADLHQTEILFIHQDYLNEKLSEIYDVIISNPPYIGRDEEAEIGDSVKGFEPKMALFSPNENALIFYEKIARDCQNFLAADGLVFLEINQKLGKETKELFTDVLSEVHLIKDLSGNERFVWGRK